DGSVISESGQAAAGGLIRDYQGHCLAAFSENLGICSITRAELRGAVSGLQLAWDRGYSKVQLQIDSQCAVLLLQSDWEVHIRHVFRESNHVADHVANRGHSCPIGFHCIELSDPVLSFWLLHDQLGVSETRLIMNER
ncbi:Putative ribonuclease H protein At1g65750, partial [Linum perenne]